MKTIHVVAAIIKDGERYFATQRGYGDFKGGWEFPGGKIEPGETPEEALCREIREELDVDVQVDCHLVTVEEDYPQFHLHMQCFLCHLTKGRPRLLEAEDARWLHVDELDDVDWLAADIQVAEAIKAHHHNNTNKQTTKTY